MERPAMFVVLVNDHSAEEYRDPKCKTGTVVGECSLHMTVFTSETEAYAAIGRTVVHVRPRANLSYSVIPLVLAESVE